MDSVCSVSFSPDGRFVLSGGCDNALVLWEMDWDYESGPRGAKNADD